MVIMTGKVIILPRTQCTMSPPGTPWRRRGVYQKQSLCNRSNTSPLIPALGASWDVRLRRMAEDCLRSAHVGRDLPPRPVPALRHELRRTVKKSGTSAYGLVLPAFRDRIG